MKKLIYVILSLSLKLISAAADENEKIPLIKQELTKEAIVQRVLEIDNFASFYNINFDVIKQNNDIKVYQIAQAYVKNSNLEPACPRKRLLSLASRARTEKWEQPYIEAIDELLDIQKQDQNGCIIN